MPNGWRNSASRMRYLEKPGRKPGFSLLWPQPAAVPEPWRFGNACHTCGGRMRVSAI